MKTNEKHSVGQYDINNKINVNFTETTKTINFFRLIKEKQNYKQYSFFDGGSLNMIFAENDIEIEPYDDIKPIFKIYNKTDDYVFFTYGNRKGFDKHLQKVLTKDKEIPTADLILENFTFILLNLKTLNIAVINNKSAASWKCSLKRLFNKYNMFYEIIPFSDKKIIKELDKSKLKTIDVVSVCPDIIYNFISFNNLDNMAENNGIIFNKISNKLEIKKCSNKAVENIIEKLSLNKDKYKYIKFDFDGKLYDLIEETITLNVKIQIPDSLEPGSKEIEDLQKIMENKLETYTII